MNLGSEWGKVPVLMANWNFGFSITFNYRWQWWAGQIERVNFPKGPFTLWCCNEWVMCFTASCILNGTPLQMLTDVHCSVAQCMAMHRMKMVMYEYVLTNAPRGLFGYVAYVCPDVQQYLPWFNPLIFTHCPGLYVSPVATQHRLSILWCWQSVGSFFGDCAVH